MNAAEIIAENIRQAPPNIKRGSLRFWGSWFGGRPFENLHTLLRCDAKQDVLSLYFDQGEVLHVWSPTGFKEGKSTFRIEDADRVRWEWFKYGRPKIEANLFFQDFVKTGDSVIASTNVDWYKPNLATDPSLPAVELLS